MLSPAGEKAGKESNSEENCTSNQKQVILTIGIKEAHWFSYTLVPKGKRFPLQNSLVYTSIVQAAPQYFPS
jgi:hypothetical protein